jgi:hypothetical protein
MFVGFSDFVNANQVSFTVTGPPAQDTYGNNGKLIKGAQPAPVAMMGIILPLSNNELIKNDNGNYTQFDRKVYVTSPIVKGSKITYKGETYEIDRALTQDGYTDVYRYYAKGKGDAYT